MPSVQLRSGAKPKADPKPKPHTDLLHPSVYKPQTSLPGHEACTFDIYPHDGFLGSKFVNSDGRMRFFVARKGRDGPVAIYTESTAAYSAKRRCEEYNTWPNTEELDEYLSNMICAEKQPPCKLAPNVISAPNAIAGPSTGPTLRNLATGFRRATAGPSTTHDGDSQVLQRAPDSDEAWRQPWWWFFRRDADMGFLTRDKYTIDRVFKVGHSAAFRVDFKDAVATLRSLLDLNPDDLLLYVLQDQQVEVDRDSAYKEYIKTEMEGSVLCCCSNIDAAGVYINELIASGLA